MELTLQRVVDMALKHDLGLVRADVSLRLARDEYRQGIEQAIPVIYEGILQAEEEYEALQQALATAQESLRVAELSYQVGLVTMADVLAAEAGVAQLEEQLLRLAVQHELAKLTLESPWVQASATPGGSSGQGSGTSAAGSSGAPVTGGGF